MATGLQDADADLIARFIGRRDEEAFRLLFRRYSPRMFALVLRLLGGRRDEAEDVMQEAWLRAASALGRFEGRAALSTWLSGIAINCARERLRKRVPEPMDPVAFDAVGREARPPALDLERAIAGLPHGYRSVFVLHDIEGYTHEEIGAALDIATGTSKSQLFQARRALRDALAPFPRKVADHGR